MSAAVISFRANILPWAVSPEDEARFRRILNIVLAVCVLLCILLLWAMFVIGKQDYSPTIGSATGIAATAGLASGDRVLRVDDREVATLGEASMALTAAAMDRRDVRLEVLDPADQVRVRTLPLSQLPAGFDERRVPLLAGLYWKAWLQPPLVEKLTDDSVVAGLIQPGDLVVAVDGQRTDSVEQMIGQIEALGRAGGPGMVEVLRGGERLALEVTPRQGKDGNGKPAWQLGIQFPTQYSPAYDTLLTLDQVQQRSRNTSLDLYGQWMFRPGLALRVAASAGVQPFGPSNGTFTNLYTTGDYTRTERYTRPQFNLSLDIKL